MTPKARNTKLRNEEPKMDRMPGVASAMAALEEMAKRVYCAAEKVESVLGIGGPGCGTQGQEPAGNLRDRIVAASAAVEAAADRLANAIEFLGG